MRTDTPHRVIIIGGGYAGAMAAIRLAGRARGRATVTLVDPDGVLVQRLRLHQLAAGQDVATYPIERLAGRRPVEVVRGWATALDLPRGLVRVADADGTRTLAADTIVLATGSDVDLTAVPGAAEHAHALASPAAAARLRAALAALHAGGEVTVVGAGATGIEAASELAGARPDLRVRLIASGALGDGLSEKGRAYLGGALARLGVEVVERARVRGIDHGAATLADGADVPHDLLVWCGGFVAAPLAAEAGLAVDERRRVLVDPMLRSRSHPHVFAVGDAGSAERMTCQAGMPTAGHAANVIVAGLRGREPAPLDFGFVHVPLSLGRRDGLIQLQHRDDTPRDRILTGRTAAVYKEVVSRSAITGLRLERRIPGSVRWLGAGSARASEPAVARA